MRARPAFGPVAPLLTAVTLVAGLALAIFGPAAATAAAATPTGVLTASSPAPAGDRGRDDTYSLIVDGDARSYRLFVPTNLPTSAERLVVALHYYGGSGPAMETVTGLDHGAAALGALVAYPNGRDRAWNAGGCCGSAASSSGPDDVAFLDAVIDDVEARYPVAPAKVAVGGWSNGGMMAYRYACERAPRVHEYFIGSGVPVAPSCPLGGRVAVLHMHGLKDDTVPWAGTKTSTLAPSGVLPGVASAVSGLAARAGCTGWAKSLISNGNTRYASTGCPAGTSVDILTSPSMMHEWSTSTSSTAHLDETGATWSFVLSH